METDNNSTETSTNNNNNNNININIKNVTTNTTNTNNLTSNNNNIGNKAEEEMMMDIEISEILPKTDVTIAIEKKNAGNEQYKAQNYRQALCHYSDAITLCPDIASFYNNRSACYMMLCDFQLALQDVQQALRIDPSFQKAYIRAIKCYLALGDVVRTEQTLKKLFEIDSKVSSVKTEITNCKQLRMHEEKSYECYDKKDYRTAIYHIDSALKISTASMKLKLLKAECLALLGRTEQAGDIAISCMKIDTTSVDAVYVRGLCLYYSDNLEKSILHFERALTLDPDNVKAKSMRIKSKNLKEKKEKGNELFKLGEYRDAIKMYSDALQIDDTNADVNSKLYYNRALVNSKIGNLRDTIQDCKCALNMNSNYLKPLLLRAKCYYALDNFQEAVNDYEEATKTDKSQETNKFLREAKLSLKKSKRKDYYKILNIERNATDEDIKKAYRKRALVHHPDRHANATDAEKREQEKKFKEVGEAYAILSDTNKKLRYDSGQDIEEENIEVDPTRMYSHFFQFSTADSQTFGYRF